MVFYDECFKTKYSCLMVKIGAFMENVGVCWCLPLNTAGVG